MHRGLDRLEGWELGSAQPGEVVRKDALPSPKKGAKSEMVRLFD